MTFSDLAKYSMTQSVAHSLRQLNFLLFQKHTMYTKNIINVRSQFVMQLQSVRRRPNLIDQTMHLLNWKSTYTLPTHLNIKLSNSNIKL